MSQPPARIRVTRAAVLVAALLTTACLSQEQEPNPAESPDVRPTWIFARNGVLFENRLLTMEQMEQSLSQRAGQAKFSPQFYFTRGSMPQWRETQQQLMQLTRELNINGMSLGSLGPRASARYDRIRRQADLQPDPKQRKLGRVLTPDGQSAALAEVILLPKTGPVKGLNVMVYLKNGRIRNRHEEDYRLTKQSGGFVVYPTDAQYYLAVFHSSGFAYLSAEEFNKQPTFRLKPWARIRGEIGESDYQQTVSFVITAPGGTEFYHYDVAVQPDGRFDEQVPGGRVRGQRSVEADGASIGFPLEEWELQPGQEQRFTLGELSDREKSMVEFTKRDRARQKAERNRKK